MAFVDKPDLKTGFWIGAGVLLAMIVLGLVQHTIGKVAERYQ